MNGFVDRLLGRVRLGGWLAVAAPVIAVAFAVLITSVVLLIAGSDPVEAFTTLADYGTQPRSMAMILNTGVMYYISALAVAVGFRMNLFNIGVDGQYRLAAVVAAGLGGAAVVPGVLNIVLVVVVAVIVGALWAAIAGLLRVYRGVSEVISTIMLNAIATGLGSWLVSEHFGVLTGNDLGTRPIPDDAHMPGIPLIAGTPVLVNGFIVVAVVLGVAYWVVLNRTRFGFELRATGKSESAAVASGVSVKKMIVVTMVMSGAVAGLIGMPELLGASYKYSNNFPAGLGFTGIAIALLGRNNPVGMAVGALLWSFLDNSSNQLQLLDISKEIVQIMQGVVVLSVIIAYELVHRYRIVAEQRRVSRELAAPQEAPKAGAAA
ncbi:ABC transporter permease [Microbispora bryophytorum]|uniref:ABC transporter permease n=3 Tax=Microbispora bryophytorum TaxID=1460882 RepID=A0A8H9GVP3_9ACTN|nr:MULTISPECIES: ABC transporter permease [Microbispora]MBD3136056.1 ABC transporter permease [Microbispora bryophytorum]MBD3143999.1 ABC transporter permease [Microbispora camponoti]TQS07811.1 ABC transporter permease [Microbispora bryophytorum]GGO04187.1 ABC transporter permease [Microbispora bryophytorum]